MDAHRSIAVSPRHSVALASELLHLVEKAPRQDFVVRTLARREANGLPLMSADLVIASAETRAKHPRAATYPMHFRKTYFPGRMHGDPKTEFDNHVRASKLAPIPPPIGYGDMEFRSCLIPGQPYSRLTPFGTDPPESNLHTASSLSIATAAGLWHLLEEGFSQLRQLQIGGLCHGDAELHNFIVSPAPLETVLIDFEVAVARESVDEKAWQKRCADDLAPLLREAVYLQCVLGQQHSALGAWAWELMPALFRKPEPFRQAIEERAFV
jgi:hypothetical protein